MSTINKIYIYHLPTRSRFNIDKNRRCQQFSRENLLLKSSAVQYRLNGNTNFAPVVVTCNYVNVYSLPWKMLPWWICRLGDWFRPLELKSISFSAFGKENTFWRNLLRFSDNFILTEQFFSLLPNISVVLFLHTLFSAQFLVHVKIQRARQEFSCLRYSTVIQLYFRAKNNTYMKVMLVCEQSAS